MPNAGHGFWIGSGLLLALAQILAAPAPADGEAPESPPRAGSSTPGSAQIEAAGAALPGAEALPPALQRRLHEALSALAPDYRPRTRNLRPDGSPLYTNRLLLEASPYLRQHAHNPVDWYPWGEQAFADARRLGRLVFVSIGYSTCHWCHVMEREIFDDPELVLFLNRHFVSIKVDREARPDIDRIYMSALHAMGVRGGWPLNVFMTADRKPFFGGTYFPPRDRDGRAGFETILRAIDARHREDPDSLHTIGEKLSGLVAQALAPDSGHSKDFSDADVVSRAVADFAARQDPEWGGVGRSAKFPSALPIRFLLQYAQRSGDAKTLGLARLTLERMAAGGIRDHVGGGFHRYATDRRWRTPHFEKMLYDNALLARAYLEAGQSMQREDFTAVAREVLDWALREMSDPAGGFYSALDADSPDAHGESLEGHYYTWTSEEIRDALGPAGARSLRARYDIDTSNASTRRGVLYAVHSPKDAADALGVSRSELRTRLDWARASLLGRRAARPRPARDEKILVAWNGLMISSLARAGFALAEPRYLDRAARAADFILETMLADARLRRVSLAGVASGPAFLEDYAFLIAGLLDLYESRFEPRWLERATALQAVLDAHYTDSAGAYYRAADDAEGLLVRERPAEDGALPSGTSVTALNLLRMADLRDDESLRERAARLLGAHSARLTDSPSGLSEMLLALEYRLRNVREIAIIAPESGADAELEAMLAPLRALFLPGSVRSVAREGSDLRVQRRLVPWLEARSTRSGHVTAYVCENRVCRLPTSLPEAFAQQLRTSLRDTAAD